MHLLSKVLVVFKKFFFFHFTYIPFKIVKARLICLWSLKMYDTLVTGSLLFLSLFVCC